MEKENKDKLPVASSVKPKDKEKNQNLGNKGSVLDFILIGEIGKGGYGRVWKAVHQLRGSFVAIKQIDLKRKVTKAQISALMMEIELLKELHHKNIVKYIDHHRTEKQLSIVMEYVENGSLADMVRHHGIFPETLVAAYMYQALDGLTYLHEQGVIHRDIKGANILISTDGTVKLADFGVATRLDSVGADADPAGSPYWMAPELISLEKGGLTTACDIWSLGCTVIELATGKPPYFDLPFATALYKIYSDDHPPLPEGISTGLKDFLMQCFQKDVNLRVSALKLMEHPWLRRAKAALAQQNTALDAAKNEIQAFQMAIQAAESTINTSPNAVVKKKSPRPKKDSPTGDDPNTPSKLKSSGGHGSSSGSSNLDKWKEEPEKKKPKSSGATAAKLSGKKVSATVKTPSGTTPSTGTKKASDGTSAKKPSKLQIQTAQENDLDKWKEVDELTNKLDLTPTPGAPKKEISPRTASKMASKSGEFFKVPAPVQKKPKVFKAKTINVKKSNRMDSDEESMGEGVANKLDQFKESESDDDFEKDFVTPQKKLKPKKLAGLERITQQLASLDIDENDPQTRENTLSGSKTVRQGEDVLFGKKLDKFTEADSDFTMDDIEFTSQSMDLNKLQLRLATNLQSNENEIPDSLETTDDYDTKANNESITDRIKEKLTRDFNTNVNKIRTETNEDELIKACDELCEVLLKYPEDKLFLLATNNGIMPMLELLESNNEKVTISALKLINTVVNSSKKLRDTICLLGGIPLITKYSSHLHCKEVRLQCAQFVKEVCNTKSLTLQMFIACGGLPSLVDFLEPDFSEFKDLIYNSLDAIWNIFELQTPTPKRAFCYLFVKSGLLSRLSVVLVNLAKVQAADPEADSYVQTVVKILLFFSKSDAQVTEKMCATDVLQPIKSLLRINVIKTEALLKLLHVIKNLSYDSHLRNLLINNGYIEVLTSLLEEQKAEKLEMIHNIALNSLFYLLQLNPQSQERAAIAGAIPPLMHLVKTRPILKEFALPLLFCLPKASEKCRELLWKHKGLDFFLTLLKDPHYFVDALVAISDWFGFEPEKVENVIKTPQNIKKIMEVFKFAEQPFAGAAVYSILEPIMSLVSASVDLNRAFSEAKLMQLLLNHYMKFVPNNDAFSKVNILKLVSNLFLHHANQLVIAEEIYPIVRKIHENQNEKVNVRNTAKLLLVAIQRLKRGSANMDQHTGGLKNQLHPSGSQSQPQFNAQAIESAHQHHHSASQSLPSTPQKNSNSKS